MTRVMPSDPRYVMIAELQHLLSVAVNQACWFDVDIPEPERGAYITE